MRRFTTVSVSMLAGIVAVPACASIVGIETDRPLLSDEGPSPTTTPTGTTSGSTSSSSGSTSGAETGPLPDDCADCRTRGFTGCGASKTDCTYACDSSKGTCPTNNRFSCPEGGTCAITCKGTFCENAACIGGKSCTFDCTNGGCTGASCSAETCTFNCNTLQVCETTQCSGDNQFCNRTCQGGKACK